MADSPSASLSGSLLARKGAAAADGFAFPDATLIAPRPPSSNRWRMAVFSTTLAISVGVIAFVGATLLFGGPWAPAVVTAPTAQAPPAPLPAAPAAVAPKPLAVAVANDVADRHGDKITAGAGAARDTVAVASPAKAVMPSTTDPSPPPQPAASPEPPEPKSKPADPVRAGYRVQLYALASDAAVRREWRRLRRRHGGLLSGLKLTVAPKRSGAGGKTFYRLQLGALSSRTQARALCEKRRRKRINCMVVR